MIHLAIGIIVLISLSALLVAIYISAKVYDRFCKRCGDEVLNKSLVDYLYEH